MAMKNLLFAACTFASLAAAKLDDVIGPLKSQRQWVAGWDRHPVPPTQTRGNATFTQLIDHDNPQLGTFEQFYYYDSEYYGGPGSPVIMFTPGEVDVDLYSSYLTTNRTTGVLAQQIKAAVVVVGHRYWKHATPFEQLTTKNYQYHTLKNAISDFTNFANHVRMPFDRAGSSQASHAPWVFMGGSYSGALAAWIASTQPGTFWAYHASSAPVEAISDYSAYFTPVQHGMPQNCSKDISLVVDHIDDVLTNGKPDEKSKLKAMFGLQSVQHDDDFGNAIANGPFLWQGIQFYQNSGFYTFCDTVENADGGKKPVPGAQGVGLDKALAGYAKWVNETLLPDYCQNTYGYPEFAGTYNTKCFDSYDAKSPIFTDMTLANTADRSWWWMLCNEPFGYWQGGKPKGQASLVSRLVDVKYFTRQCGLFFPEQDGFTYGIAKGRTEDGVNRYTKGWDFTNSKRLIWVNGENDPWRESGVSSDYRPLGPLASTSDAPVVIVPSGYHTSDLVTRNGQVNAGAKKAIDQVVAQLKTWVDQYPRRH